jgi:hypothetical protein
MKKTLLAGFALSLMLSGCASYHGDRVRPDRCFGPVVEVRRVPCVSHWEIIGIDACGRRQTQFAIALADNPTGHGWSYQISSGHGSSYRPGWRLVTQDESNGKWTIVTPIDGDKVKVETVDCLP